MFTIASSLRYLFLSICFVALLSACTGSVSTPSSSTPTVIAQTPIPTATPTPTPAHTGQSADQILQGLKTHGLPIGESFTYTAENDVNKLLGRPGQYIGKLNFKDTRIPSTKHGIDISVPDGGSLEVFATATDAQNRFNYIQSISKSSPLFAEYEYRDGLVILRISSQLTPDQAKAYEDALKTLP
jgi:hypothetical protein